MPVGLAIGQGRGGLEVAVTRTEHRPTQQVMRAAWNARLGGRAVPLLLVALHGDRAALCGEHGDDPPVYLDLDRGMVERLCRTALAEPDRHAASRFLRAAMPELESPLPGLRNEGLFATHELARDVPQRRDWADAQTRAAPLLGLRGRRLLGALGYQIEALPGHAAILWAGDTRIAVAVFLERGEACDVASDRFGSLSPISYALAKADAESLPYVVVDRGPALRIYPTATGVGTGGRGRTETFIEVHLDLLPTGRATCGCSSRARPCCAAGRSRSSLRTPSGSPRTLAAACANASTATWCPTWRWRWCKRGIKGAPRPRTLRPPTRWP